MSGCTACGRSGRLLSYMLIDICDCITFITRAPLETTLFVAAVYFFL